jgi:hypothetical protein
MPLIPAQVESLDAVLDGVAGAQNQYRFLESGLAPLAQQIQSISVLQTEIQDDQIVGVFAERVAGRGTGMLDLYSVSALGQPLPHELSEADLIFNDKNFHGSGVRNGPRQVYGTSASPVPPRRFGRSAAVNGRCQAP